MRGYISILLVTVCLLLASCAQKNAGPAPHATIVMRDGTQYTGTVTSSSASEVTLKGDDNTAHTLAMKDVESIEYDDTPAPPEAQPPQTAQAPARPGARRLRERSHEDHYHPEQAAITTKTMSSPSEPSCRFGLRKPSIPDRRLRARPTPPRLPGTCSMPTVTS